MSKKQFGARLKKKTPAKHLLFGTKVVSGIRGFEINKVEQLHMMRNPMQN